MLIKPAYAASLQEIYKPADALGGTGATIGKLISPLIYNIFILSGLIAFVVIIISGFNYITAGGDKAKISQAQHMLNYGILGLIVVASAFLITRIIGAVIGFNFF